MRDVLSQMKMKVELMCEAILMKSMYFLGASMGDGHLESLEMIPASFGRPQRGLPRSSGLF